MLICIVSNLINEIVNDPDYENYKNDSDLFAIKFGPRSEN